MLIIVVIFVFSIQGVLDQGLVELSWSVDAHKEALTCMELVQDPHIILTGSADQVGTHFVCSVLGGAFH